MRDRGKRIAPERIDPRLPANCTKHFFRGKRPFVWIGEPEVMNQRLVAQSGTFAIPSVLDRDVASLIVDTAGPDALVQLVLAHDRVRDQGLRELYAMNITQATLFPDLDGLARSMAYELEFHWAFDPHTMRGHGQPAVRRGSPRTTRRR